MSTVVDDFVLYEFFVVVLRSLNFKLDQKRFLLFTWMVRLINFRSIDVLYKCAWNVEMLDARVLVLFTIQEKGFLQTSS